MNKVLLTAAALIAFAAPALAAERMSKAGVPAGAWCQKFEADDVEGWMWFKRGKCASDDESTTLILKPNGDYIFTGIGDEMECKVNAKTYFKGWAAYACTVYGGRAMKQPQRMQKFVINTTTGELGLNTGD